MTPPQRELPLRAHAQILPATSCVKSIPIRPTGRRGGIIGADSIRGGGAGECPLPLKPTSRYPAPDDGIDPFVDPAGPAGFACRVYGGGAALTFGQLCVALAG